MDWIPVVFVVFKALVLVTGMFFAIKWHYDQGKRGKPKDTRAVLRASVKVAVLFVLVLLMLTVATFIVSRMLGLDLTMP